VRPGSNSGRRGRANVRETLAACEAYAEMGARAVAIVAPFYYS